MFAEMIVQLQSGVLPDSNLLRQRFDRALVKKLGVIKTPPSFWTADKKINPASKELLWAAILLEDRENYQLVEGIIATEIVEKSRASGRSRLPVSAEKTIKSYISELNQLAPTERFSQTLLQKIKKTTG
jgi:hypothetical protein